MSVVFRGPINDRIGYESQRDDADAHYLADAIEAQLNDTDLYQAENKNTLTDLLKQQAQLKDAIEENEMVWLDLSEQIEEIMSQVTTT